MAARTTPTLVGTVIDITPGDTVTAFIDSANEIVTDQCLASSYTDVRLELIERWLAAHFYATDRRRTLTEGVAGGPYETRDRPVLDLFLYNTPYGQQAVALDTAGNLAAMVNTMKVIKKTLPSGGARVSWLGTP